MRWRRLAALLAIFVLVATACTSNGSSSKNGKVTLQLWAYEGYQDYLPVLVKAFEKKYPNITVEVTDIPESQYITKVDTALAAHTPPDLGFTYTDQWLKEGAFLPLDSMIKKDHIDISTWTPGIIGPPGQTNAEDACSFGGHIYCLGSYTGAVMVFYNKDMFDKAGLPYPKPWPAMTVDQYAKVACELTSANKGSQSQFWGTANGDPVTWLPWETWVSPDGKNVMGYVNGPTAVGVEQTFANMIQQGCAPSLNVLDPWEQGVDYFSEGKLAMVITDFQSLFKIEKAGINYGVTAVPYPPGIPEFFNEWTDDIGVFTDSKNSTAAQQFVAFQGTEGQKLRVQVTGDVPVSTAVAQQLNWADDTPGRQEALQIFPHARPNVIIPDRWDVFGPLFDADGLITSGKETPQQALNDAAPKIQANLDKAWQVYNQS
jgi:multiple sugar transport system substrate-binding protein